MMQTPGQRDRLEFDARLRALGESSRVWRLDKLERLWNGTSYDGRPSFWDKSQPVQERAPCIVHPVARIAGQRLASLVFGESRFPRIAPTPGRIGVGDLTLSDGEGGGVDECAIIADVIVDIVQRASLKIMSRSMLCDGLKIGTAVPVVGLTNGLPSIELLPAKWCTPTFSPIDHTEVTRLVMAYRRPGDPARGGEDPDRSYWYRREITERTDTVWNGIEAREDGKPIQWEFEPHAPPIALEFCPVVWARNLADTSCHDQIDGIALADGLDDECEALDLAHSMRHRNALYNGDPLQVFTGAGPEDLTAERGRDVNPAARTPVTGTVDMATGRPAMQSTSHFGRAASSGDQIKRAPGAPLFFRKEGVTFGLMESSGAGNKILADDAEAIRALVFEAMSVIVANPDAFATGDLSARALSLLFRPMLDLADNLRECWGAVIARIVSKLLRLCASPNYAGKVFVRGIEEARPILARFQQGTRWIDPPLALTWGPYFEPSRAELQSTATYLATATGNQAFMSQRAAVTHFAAAANLGDAVDEEHDAVQAEQAQQSGDLTAAMGALAPGDAAAPVADAAMNGAQVSSLQGIVTAAASGEIPPATAREIILIAFPTVLPDRVDAMLAPIIAKAGTVDQVGALTTDNAAAKRSIASLKSALKRIMARDGIKSITESGSGANVSDEEVDAIVTELAGPDGDIATDD